MLETTAKEFNLGSLLKDLPTQIDKLNVFRKLVLTDAVLLGEIPSPTFNEEDRIRLTVDRFRENGLEVTHVTQTLSAVAAPHDVALDLRIAEGSPLLSLVRRSYNLVNGEEHLRDYLHVLYNPEHFQYKMDLKID